MANLVKRDMGRMVDPWKDFFDLGLWGSRGMERNNFPAVNISDDEKAYMVDVVAPGFKKEDFKINVEEDMLTISAEVKKETEEGKGRDYSRREFSYSSFTRSFHLPENAKDDQISARYQDGILHLSIPKTEKQVKATKQINIE